MREVPATRTHHKGKRIASLSIKLWTNGLLCQEHDDIRQGLQYHYENMRVTVVSKDALARDGLSSILLQEGQFAFAGASDCVHEGLELLGATGGVLVATDDLSKSDWNNLAKAKDIHSLRVVAIVDGKESNAARVADLMIARSEGSKPLVSAIKTFVTPTPKAVAEALQLRYGGKRLSKRELEVAQFVAQGFGNRRISQILELREQSVKNLVSCIMTKLDCDNRTQVALALLGREKAS